MSTDWEAAATALRLDRHARSVEYFTDQGLDELEAQIDPDTTYYVPALIAEIRRLRALLKAQEPTP